MEMKFRIARRIRLSAIFATMFSAIIIALLAAVFTALLPGTAVAQTKRKVIIDQDCAGPGGTDMQAVLTIVNSPETDVLGVTVLTGDAWRDEEVLHALRLLEIVGRTDIPVVPGAVFPLVNTKEEMARWENIYGRIIYQGAWNWGKPVHGPYEIPPMPEGKPTTKAIDEDAAHFLIRMVRKYPHEVTIYAAGPMTNLALAINLDPEFASLAKELIVMGGGIAPETSDPEFVVTPRREFNFWIDAEATKRVLRAPWPRIVVTTVDISVKTKMSKDMIAQIAAGTSPSAKYIAKYAEEGYLWDELAAAAWLDPSMITKSEKLYMDVSIDHGASYGDTMVWVPGQQPGLGEQLVEVQEDLDLAKFYREFVALMTAETPGAHAAGGASAGVSVGADVRVGDGAGNFAKAQGDGAAALESDASARR
jgi:purine nucleosidase